MSPLNNNSIWDPHSLRLVQSGGAPAPARVRHGRRASPIHGKFIAGPVDVSWVCRASRLGVKALLVGLALWHIKGLRRSDTFLVSNVMVEQWGIRRDAKSRALRTLEKAGLIRMARRGKRSPEVTLLLGATV